MLTSQAPSIIEVLKTCPAPPEFTVNCRSLSPPRISSEFASPDEKKAVSLTGVPLVVRELESWIVILLVPISKVSTFRMSLLWQEAAPKHKARRHKVTSAQIGRAHV